MRGSFGELQFELVNSPIAFKAQQKSNYAEHPRVEDKPVLQWTSFALDIVKVTFRFDYIHTDPAASLATLQQMLLTPVPYPLITVTPYKGTIYGLPYGSDDCFTKEYVLESVDTVVRHTDHSGRLIYIDVTCTLKECVQDMALSVGGGAGGIFGGLGGIIGGIFGF